MARALKRLRRRLLRPVLRTLPHRRWLDHLLALAHFRYFNGRMPRRGSTQLCDVLFWLKTAPEFDDDLRTRVTDKLEMKEYVAEVFGRALWPRTLAVFEHPGEVTEDTLPARCMIKPTNLSGEVVPYDRAAGGLRPGELRRIRDWFRDNQYFRSRERNYRRIRTRVFCEEIVMDPSDTADLKITCFDGTARLLHIDRNVVNGPHTQMVYDLDWRPVDVRVYVPSHPVDPRPERLDEMVAIAERLAADFPMLRVDFMIGGARYYVGEMTVLPNCARLRCPTHAEEIRLSELMFERRGRLGPAATRAAAPAA